MNILSGLVGFEWDAGNLTKNWKKHRVSALECEQVFFNRPLVLASTHRSGGESRYYALGQTDNGRKLFVVLTLRDQLIRVISARDMGKKERRVYEQEIERAPEVPE